MAETGPVELVLGRSANVMVVDGTSVFFAVLSRVEWVSVELVGCKTWVLQLFSQQFLQLSELLQPAALCQKGLAPQEIVGCG